MDKVLDVYFFDKETLDHGTALLEINLISDNAVLRLDNKLYINEVLYLIEKALNDLKNMGQRVTPDIHWDTQIKEEDK